MLYIQHLTKRYGEKKAVDDLSLHIAPGEIYGFIGHNGAGKTTTPLTAIPSRLIRWPASGRRPISPTTRICTTL